jgi:nitroimidazol reductase NimA-like FMN-containing flavoprotein (pyridoxamine 5'-phosphate oxidase superfamily)
LKENGRTDRADLLEVLRAGFVCHLGVIVDGTPMVVPTVYGFDASWLYFHGSVASRSLTGSTEVCVTVTHIDGLVIARSVFEHSVNYHSAMIYGVPRALADAEKLDALRILSEHSAPGQWEYARQPSRRELAATTILALSLNEASVKISSGDPEDAGTGDDLLPDGSHRWAGVIPLSTTWGSPTPDAALPAGTEMPGHLIGYGRKRNQCMVIGQEGM